MTPFSFPSAGTAALLAAVSGPAAAIPPAPGPEVARWIGEYGAKDGLLTIYEADGALSVDGHGFKRARLVRQTDETYQVLAPGKSPVRFSFRADAVWIDGSALPRRDIGAEVVAAIQAGTQADPSALRTAALTAKPPAEPAPKRPADLVDLSRLDPLIKLDIRYATTNNFMGFPLYERAAAYLQRPAAEALLRVQKALEKQGYGLMIFDGYRPWFVTKMFWEATPVAQHVFVADPATGSRHNRGCAVDLSLYDLKTGAEVEMTGRYDEMSQRSFADYVGGTSRQRALRDLLRQEMQRQGFEVYPQEWWHFDYKDWRDYGIGTETFAELQAARQKMRAPRID